ncbi:hypothetical protein M7I_6469 [Glarea lozoyensis 74030]|uniref:Uncharacterized protein n=1 Tax=Glarea lozoyensis (strain ATCC 74030 / MF5533) TaxID=1104152 RepID=H0EUN2_GLAL7|nr:hypothetical protein M7I_6469 [Glarea lozoyensis 74030]
MISTSIVWDLDVFGKVVRDDDKVQRILPVQIPIHYGATLTNSRSRYDRGPKLYASQYRILRRFQLMYTYEIKE